MGFFKDFKNDMKQAVNELIPGNEEMTNEYDDEDMVNTLEEPGDEEYINTMDDDTTGATNADTATSSEYTANYSSGDIDDIDIEDIEDFDFDENDFDESESGYDSDMDSLADLLSGNISIEDVENNVVENKKEKKKKKTKFGKRASEEIVETPEPETVDIGGASLADLMSLLNETPGSEEVSNEEPTIETLFSEDTPMPTEAEEISSLFDTPETVDDVNEQMEDLVEDRTMTQDEIVPEASAEEVMDNLVEESNAEETSIEESSIEEATQAENEVEMEESTMAEDKIIDITSIKETETVEPEAKLEDTIKQSNASDLETEVSDSTTYITKGTRINGNLFTDGSIDILGTVEGDVNCYGKLVISGTITGKVNAGEIYANAAKIEGEVTSAGSVKIGVGSVIVGNIDAQSAVIAGAVNGDLDVKGPVIVDSTAVIMGNIKSRSVQINNGAVIEGFCSQCYSDIDVKSFFA